MRRTILTILMLSSCASGAAALEANDSMQAWKHASDAERSAFLKKLGIEGASIERCMDETSTTPGHSSLPISEVAKACASKGKPEQPV